ncbi:MAG TPA: exodeoxyribonuclease VII large subunit [Candidatus Coprocola pullicola]|nr:exodeoxyribonuclease VII large subunit [Candidatus Coprocola pullicola]
MEVKVYSVEQINRYIRNLLENDFILNSFWVKGEISNFKAHSSGHLYFTLKDAFASIQCVMFEGAAQLLPFLPENGLSVAVCGYVSVYEKTGQYQLYAELIEPLGVGSLTLAFEQLKEKLAVEGLFDAEYKREICPYPKCVAVVTSPTGAAVRDVIRIIKRRNHTVKIVVVPVLVQGEYAPDSIVEGIKLVNQWGKADTLIVGRGGGSLEDLWAFNEEKVARAIFASEIPVISAVGHETDFTIADFVADLRASTPSAAAELSVKNLEDMTEQFQSVVSRLEYAVTNQMIQWKKRLEFIVQAKVLQQPLIQIQKQDSYIKQLQKQLEKQVYYILEKKQQKYNALKQQLDAVSPLKVLQRGYLLAKNEKGATLTTVKSIQKGENITLYFQDGTARATIIERSIQKSGKEEIDI